MENGKKFFLNLKNILQKIKGIYLLVFFVCGFLIIYPSKIKAESPAFKVNYIANYNIEQENSSFTHVLFSIKITNLRSDKYIKKFTLSFPQTFEIKNLIAKINGVPTETSIIHSERQTLVGIEIQNPEIGKGQTTTINLEFYQAHLFKKIGNIVEVILPTMQKKSENYTVHLNLPPHYKRKISLSKPIPTHISHNTITWINPKTKVIYAILSDKQIYSAKFIYTLHNPKVYPIRTEIALPPDSLYQKIYLKNIVPLPFSIKLDDDLNYLAEYRLLPGETKKIKVEMFIETFTSPREVRMKLEQKRINIEQQYCLQETKYWRINNLNLLKNLETPRKIYNFVTSYLNYNFKKINNNKRVGAEEALKHPNFAVCSEFTDLFIAIARSKGICSREIEGFAVSEENKFRPISKNSDILHSWPEYWDTKLKIWKPVDPTWGKTSGIDYFNSLDLNHIVFVVHNKQDNYPIPAGSYKDDYKKTIYITPTNIEPKEHLNIELNFVNLPKEIEYKNKNYEIKIKVKNRGNIFAYNLPIKIKSDVLQLEKREINLDALAPLQEKIIKINAMPLKTKTTKRGYIQLDYSNKRLRKEVKLVSPYYKLIKLLMYGVPLIVLILLSKKIFHHKLNNR